jgi:transcriptional antiterminator RfaH
MSYWAVAQIAAQRSKLATELLKIGGYEIYAPQIQLGRNKRKRTVLLFPSYIFVRIVEQFYAAKNTPGVIRLLMAGEQPAKMPERVLDTLRGREHKGYIRLPPKTPRHGSTLRIINGPFAGHLALFDGMSGPDRQRVLLEFMAGVVSIELPVRDAVPLDIAPWSVLSY